MIPVALAFRLRLKDREPAVRLAVARELFEHGGEEACVLLRQCLTDPDESVRLYAAQALETVAKRYQKLLRSLRASIAEAPDDVYLREEIADALAAYAERCMDAEELRHHIYEEALSHLETGLKKRPGDPALLLKRGAALFKLSRYDEARAALLLVPMEAEEFPLARFRLAETALAQGRPQEARQEAKRLLPLFLPVHMKEAVEFWAGVPALEPVGGPA